MRRALVALCVILVLAGKALAGSAIIEYTEVPGAIGYKLYYRLDASGPPYDGTGATEGDSPVAIGPRTATLHNIDWQHHVYYIVVTAVYATGESGYSNEVNSKMATFSGVGSRTPAAEWRERTPEVTSPREMVPAPALPRDREPLAAPRLRTY